MEGPQNLKKAGGGLGGRAQRLPPMAFGQTRKETKNMEKPGKAMKHKQTAMEKQKTAKVMKKQAKHRKNNGKATKARKNP